MVKLSFSVPPILLATIALQKSSCNPASVGSNSEQGLMQLTSDKCSNAPSGNCQDVVRAIRSPFFVKSPNSLMAFLGFQRHDRCPVLLRPARWQQQ